MSHCVDRGYLNTKMNEALHRKRLEQERQMAEQEALVEKRFNARMAEIDKTMTEAADDGRNSASYGIDDPDFDVADTCLKPRFKWPEKPNCVMTRILMELIGRNLQVTAETCEDQEGGTLIIRW